MYRFPRLSCLGLILVLAMPALAAPPKEGTYELATRPSATGEAIAYLIKLEVKDGAVTGSLAASAEMMGDVTLKDVALDGDTLRFTIKTTNGSSTFEGRVDKPDATEIFGSFGTDARLMPARLTITEKTTIGRQPLSKRLTVPEPLAK